MTALEYPVDANESPEAAQALYESIAQDKVLVWEQSPRRTQHRYMVWNYTSPAFGAVSYAIGEFVHTADGKVLDFGGSPNN